MATWIYYEIGVGLLALFSSALFLAILNQNSHWQWRRIAYKFTAALTFFSVTILSRTISETWDPIGLAGIEFPPLQVIFEAVIIAFMISGLWDIWTRNLEE